MASVRLVLGSKLVQKFVWSRARCPAKNGYEPDGTKMAVACSNPALEWFAIRVRSRAESTVSRFLRIRGFDTICPTFQERRQYSDRIKTLESALFPGYLFCQMNRHDRFPILSAPGVETIVGFGREPHPVDPLEIAAVQAVMRSGLLARPHPFLRIGQRVRVASGPLASLEGILVATKNDHRLVVSVSLLQRSIAAELDSAQILPIS
jgi:transcription antitermination factor NusG